MSNFLVRPIPEEGVTRASDSIKGATEDYTQALDLAWELWQYTHSDIEVINTEEKVRVFRLRAEFVEEAL